MTCSTQVRIIHYIIIPNLTYEHWPPQPPDYLPTRFHHRSSTTNFNTTHSDCLTTWLPTGGLFSFSFNTGVRFCCDLICTFWLVPSTPTTLQYTLLTHLTSAYTEIHPEVNLPPTLKGLPNRCTVYQWVELAGRSVWHRRITSGRVYEVLTCTVLLFVVINCDCVLRSMIMLVCVFSTLCFSLDIFDIDPHCVVIVICALPSMIMLVCVLPQCSLLDKFMIGIPWRWPQRHGERARTIFGESGGGLWARHWATRGRWYL